MLLLQLLTFLFGILLGLFASTSAMKEELSEIRDQSLTTNLDINWFQNQSKWYFPLLSPFKIWKFCTDSHDKHFCHKTSEEKIMQAGCTYWTPPTNTSIFGQFVKYDQVLVENEIVWRKQGTTGEFRHFRFAFTDNKTFVLGLNEWEGGEICWMVLSPLKTLPQKTVQSIRHFAEAFGFLEKLIFVNSADNCKDEKEDADYDEAPYQIVRIPVET